MANEESQEMQKEWRAIVLSKLNSLETSQKELNNSMNDVKTSFVKQATLDVLQERVNKLEAFKWKLVGGMLALQGVWAVATFYLYYMQGVHPK